MGSILTRTRRQHWLRSNPGHGRGHWTGLQSAECTGRKFWCLDAGLIRCRPPSQSFTFHTSLQRYDFGSLSLNLLLTMLVPNFHLCQTPAVRSSHSHHHIVLGHCLYVQRLHPKLRRPHRLSASDRLLRGLLVSRNDASACELVQERRACSKDLLPLQ